MASLTPKNCIKCFVTFLEDANEKAARLEILQTDNERLLSEKRKVQDELNSQVSKLQELEYENVNLLKE